MRPCRGCAHANDPYAGPVGVPRTVEFGASRPLPRAQATGSFPHPLVLPTGGYAEEHFPGTSWRCLPADSDGWSTATLAKTEAWSKVIGSTAVMIVQHGLVVAQWGEVGENAARLGSQEGAGWLLMR